MVVVTARCEEAAEVYAKALRAKAGTVLRESHIDLEVLGVTDPVSGGQSVHVGSGGATVNALLTVAEHLTARKGEATVNGDVLRGVHVLVVHAGGEEQNVPPFLPYTKAFDSVSTTDALHVDRLLHALALMCEGAAPGLWVCSTQGILTSTEWQMPSRSPRGGVTVFAALGSYQEAAAHGGVEP